MSSSIVHRLNEDILLAVLSYLPGYDVVQLARTCKFMYALSCPSFSVKISYWDQHQLSRRAEAICRPGSSSASCLQDLELALMSHSRDEDIKAVCDILRTTKNLRTLSLSIVIPPGGVGYPSIVHALTQMKDLRALRYSPIFLDGILPMIEHIPSPNLANLYLWYDVNWDPQFPPLLSVLRSFPKLVTLTLSNFVPQPTSLDATRTSLPSIRHIILENVSVAATDILYLCPNLDTIDLSPSYGWNFTQGHMEPQPRWPKVSRLTVAIQGRARRWYRGVEALDDAQLQTVFVELLERRASAVSRLELAGEWEFTRDGVTAVDADTLGRLARLLAALQPRVLTLLVHATGLQTPEKRLDGWMWTEVARALPCLRALTLRCAPRLSWVPPETLPAALAQLSLRCLFIDTSPVDDPKEPGSDRRELERVKAFDALPTKLVPALTEMRVLGFKGTAALPADAFKNLKAEACLEELEEWRKDHGERNTRWWRVDGVGEERTLVELWREYGEQAQKIVEDSEEDGIAEDLDAIYLDRCRYEP
ncbi:uncharacterized protein BXZ73DRAFT_104496 [Epithele typhae]|uniref:uncharacterized protein n=1 Tax=Epithele typhae TaxID=378194 RepID=UPI002008D1B1|nr:uncharacterized protein BXZ73DRAFT_104496 [Epithele typhae]KAH9921208.1 hypothetical protein BXZ73DRAFT_104496 [Epithele typhae]